MIGRIISKRIAACTIVLGLGEKAWLLKNGP